MKLGSVSYQWLVNLDDVLKVAIQDNSAEGMQEGKQNAFS